MKSENKDVGALVAAHPFAQRRSFQLAIDYFQVMNPTPQSSFRNLPIRRP